MFCRQQSIFFYAITRVTKGDWEMFKDNQIIAILEKIDAKIGQLVVLQKGNKIKSITKTEDK